ncbi:MAG TPA: Crp/Fnr family transcriptional regulator [Candidatus Hydrogenedentes bacterium]|nr:Crp/Fnr family transcriptional regulator [Candidatus Hydrogenedentota bacterium]HPG69521.1 Crp/Fnr family transcriptional regulator [Candidatus Hydrogenedentota bacterium]
MKRYMKLALSLREDPFFRTMSDGLVERIEEFVFHREFEPRQIVYFPDDACDYGYWVREGRVRVTRVSGDGRELTLRHLMPGDVFGEECLVNRAKHEAYAEAMAPSILCLLRADDLRRLAREEPELSFKLAQRLCNRAAEVEQVLAETVFRSVRSRVAAGLMRLHRSAPSDPEGMLHVTHQELANLVGSTRETTTVVLHALKDEGIVKIANRRVRLLDPARLEHIAGERP